MIRLSNLKQKLIYISTLIFCVLLNCFIGKSSANINALTICFNHIGESDKPLVSFCLSDSDTSLQATNGRIMLILPSNKATKIKEAIESALPAPGSELEHFGTFKITVEKGDRSQVYVVVKSETANLIRLVLSNLPESSKTGKNFMSALLQRLNG